MNSSSNKFTNCTIKLFKNSTKGIDQGDYMNSANAGTLLID